VDAPTLAIQIEGGKTPFFPAKELQEFGYNAVAYALSTLYATAFAVRGVLKELMDKGTTSGYWDKMFDFNEYNQFLGLEALREKEQSYNK
jgi:methylisocitrate lyase